jgi:hypothetical protein
MKWVQRMFRLPIHLHSALVLEARRRGVEVNDLVVKVLTECHEAGWLSPRPPDHPNGTKEAQP